MNDELYSFLSREEFESLIKRYENVRQGKEANSYFDVVELEGLLDYHLENSMEEDVQFLLKMADQQHPNSTGIDIRRAKHLFSNGKFRETYSLISKLEKIEPSNSDVFLLKGLVLVVDKKLKEAKEAFDNSVRLSEGENEEVYYTIAVALESARQYKEAMRYFKKAYQNSNEEDLDLLYDLAYCAEKAGYYEDSIRYYHQYLDENPFSETAWYNLGVNYHSQKKYDKSLEAFEYALTIEPEYIMAMHGKADILVRIEDYTTAIKFYQKAMDFSEEDAEGLCEIGECYRMLDNAKEARKFYNRSLELDKTYADAKYGIGVLQYEAGDFLESINSLKQAIKDSPYNADYWYAFGVTCSEINFVQDAEEAFEKAVDMYPYDPEFWISYAELKYKAGNVDNAMELLERGNDINKQNAGLKYRLAALCYKKEDPSKGLDLLREALALNKDDSNVFIEMFPEAIFNDELSKILFK